MRVLPKSECREMMSGVVTAADALSAVPMMRRAQVLRVDEFERACRNAGPSKQVRMPPRALNLLVSANINYPFADTIDTAIARYLGSPFSPNVLAQNSIRCDAIRQVYMRACSRRPRWSRPCAVTPIVRCTLLACIRSKTPNFDPNTLLPLLETELRLDPLGLLTIPSTNSGLRRCLRVALVSVFVILACRRFLRSHELLVRVATRAVLLFDSGVVLGVAAKLFSEHVDAKCKPDPWKRHWYLAAVYIFWLLLLA